MVPEGIESSAKSEKMAFCLICQSDIEAKFEWPPMVCQHYFCEECMKEYILNKLMHREFHKLKCPLSYCDMKLGPEQLGHFLTKRTYKRMINKRLLSNKCMVCPRCHFIQPFVF